MAHISYPYKKTNKAVFHKPTSIVSKDAVHWKKLGLPVLVKEYGAIDYLDFCPLEPHYFAATCSVRVQIYDPITKVVAKNISQFVEGAYGGCFRGDGRLLVAGSEEAAIKLFDVQSKNILRVFNGHTGPVHRTFFTKDQVKIFSCCDDKSVALWDIATEAKLTSFSEHTDYIRAGAVSPVSPDIILSGGYDHTVKLYDCRSNETILTVNHGDLVESTLFLPSGGIFVSAGGTEIKVWDIFNGGKLLSSISQHHKTVTTLRLASNNSRLMSASLDRHVKVYDVSTFKVVHNIDFPNAVLSMAISENDDILAVGMVDGVISISKREHAAKKERKEHDKKATFKFAPDIVQTAKADTAVKKNNIVKKTKNVIQMPFDTHLRKMEYSRALASVFRSSIHTKYPEKSAAVLQELLKRKVLHPAMLGLEEKHIGKLLLFLRSNLGEIRFNRTVIDSINVLIDVFGNQWHLFSHANQQSYKTLLKKVKFEIEVCKSVCELEGAIGLLLAGAQQFNTNTLDSNDALIPSENAKREVVIDVE